MKRASPTLSASIGSKNTVPRNWSRMDAYSSSAAQSILSPRRLS